MAGLLPRKYKDHRRYSFHRTFGSTAQYTDIDLDTGLSNFNQNEPNAVTGDPAYPNGCTGFCRADIATNEDKIVYKPGFSYEKSCLIAGVPVGSPVSLEDSFKSGIVYGLQAVGETTDAQALAHRRGPYFEVENTSNYFDSLWSAMLKGSKPVSIGTPWFPELMIGESIDSIVIRSTNDWHNWEACGVKTINGISRIKVKAWTGDVYYFGRQVINSLIAVQGSDCLCDTDGKATPADVQTVRLNVIQTLISYCQRLISYLQSQQVEGSTEVVSLYQELEEEIQIIQEEIQAITHKPMTNLDKFCTAIRDFEGVPGDLNYKNNNPGNCRCSPMGYLAKYGDVKCINNFAVFPTYELGWEYLENLVYYRIEAHPTWTFLDFFNVYAPTGDNNNPNNYANHVAAQCGVSVDTVLSTWLA